jgi:hypothetical protein
MEIGSFLLNWGVLAVGLILFGIGCLWMSFYKKAYKKHVLRYGRGKFGKEYGTSWTRADTIGLTGMVIFWIVCIPAIVGALLFFFTALPQIGIPLWIGCTLGIAGVLLLFFAHGGSTSLIKREVEIALRHKVSGLTADAAQKIFNPDNA